VEIVDEAKKVSREREQVAKLYAQLVGSPLVKIPSKGLIAPMQQGVYVIYGPNGRVLHVGSTPSGLQGIWQRLRNHLHKASSFTLVHLKGNGAQLRNGYGFRCVIVTNHRLRALLEHYAIGHLCPAHLGIHNKGNKPSLPAAMEQRIVRLRAGL
jgi:hypothetical protein